MDLSSLYETYPQHTVWLRKFEFLLNRRSIGARDVLLMDIPSDLLNNLLYKLVWDGVLIDSQSITLDMLYAYRDPSKFCTLFYYLDNFLDRDVEELVVPEGVTEWDILISLPNIKKIVFPSTLESLYLNVPALSLEDVYIPYSLKSLRCFFYSARSPFASKIDVDNGLEYYNNLLVGRPELLGEGVIDIREGTTVLKQELFFNDLFTELRVPEGVLKIPLSFCTHCQRLKTLHLPSTLVEIEDTAFYACDNLGRLNFENGVPKLRYKKRSFSGCSPSLKLPKQFRLG